MSYLDAAVERVRIGEVGKSGAALERVVLPDGRRLVVKRLNPESDLTMAVTGDNIGREYLLWKRGVLDRLPDGVDHAVVDGWVEDDATVLVMRDLGNHVLTWDDLLSREQCRRVLAGATAMHRAFLGAAPSDLTPLADLLAMFAPDRMTPHLHGSNPLPALSIRGWQVFADLVPDEVASPVLRLLADPRPLADALAARPTTLIHGDLATVNVAVEDGRVILIDWAMPAAAPAAVDLARFVAGCSSVVDATREEIIADFRELAGPAYDAAALHLGLLSGLVWLGWNKALDAAENPDPAVRERERADLEWWVDHARTALAERAF